MRSGQHRRRRRWCWPRLGVTECGLDQWGVDLGEFLANGSQVHVREAALDRAAVSFDVLGDQAVDQVALFAVEVTAIGKQVGDG